MVLEKLAELAKDAERKLGLPPLSKVADTLDKFPDAKQLKLIKETLEVAEKVSKTAPELDKVIGLMSEINSMPVDKLDKLQKLLKTIQGIMKTKGAEELLGFLTSLKEE